MEENIKSTIKDNSSLQVRYACARQKAALRAAVELKKPMTVFCSSPGQAEETARIFCAYFGHGKAKFYHSGMTYEEKARTRGWFASSKEPILVTVQGCGMDRTESLAEVYLDCFAPGRVSVLSQGKNPGRGAETKTVIILSSCGKAGLHEEDSIAEKAWDAMLAYRFIRKHRRLYTKEETVNLLLREYNNADRDFYKKNVWEARDVQEILSRLMGERLIRIMGGLWKGRVDICRPRPMHSFHNNIRPARFLHCLRRFARHLPCRREEEPYILS